MPDQSIDVTLFSGAVRNSENKHMAQVLRKKSKILVAYGSCAYMGGSLDWPIFIQRKKILTRVYEESESTLNPGKVRPLTEYEVAEEY